MNTRQTRHVLSVALLASFAGMSVQAQKVTPGSGGAFDLGESAKHLVTQISASLSKHHKGRITILPLRERDEPTTGLGALFADELETRLSADGNLEIVQRTELDERFGQITSNAFGAIDSKTAKEIGSVAGVDAIVTGTIAILPSEVVVHCRVVDALSGKSLAVAQTRALRDHDVVQDLDELLRHQLFPKVVQVR